ncbi:MAG TPA: hypothetical protein VN493_19295 [Thermoanaerobaculia bacterium]|nr:hypothetical protein [Thermoanaerobaculia bacterium]
MHTLKRARFYLCSALLLCGLLHAARAVAVPPPPCSATCNCTVPCTTKCSLSSGAIVNCGWLDRCIGGIGCGPQITAPEETSSTAGATCRAQDEDLLAAIFG